MENLTKTNTMPFELAHFQVEELEERLENKWGRSNDAPTTQTCTVSVTTYVDGSGKQPFYEFGRYPIDECPSTKYCVQYTSGKICL